MDVKASLFPSAYDVPAPQGAEDWKSIYPYYMQFQPSRRETEDQKFWFCNSQHWPTPFKPFDCVMVEFATKCLGQYNTRHLLVPPANGVDYRILNGYVYFSPIGVEPSKIEARIPEFLDRAGHYYQNWDSLLANWKKKVLATIDELNALSFEALPDVVDAEKVKGGVGLDPTTDLFATYDKAIHLCYVTWQYHFEFLNLGYAAYLDFFGFVKEQFPSIPDQAIAKMVQGVDSELFRPDDELKKLAKLAVELGLVDALNTGSVDDALAAVAAAPNGQKWLDAWKASQDPWFNFTSGNGFYSSDKYWIDHLDIPMGYLRDYIQRLLDGDEIMRPTEKLLSERDRITAEYREMMDEEAQAVFDGKLGLSRTVFPYVEDHNFYIEHWALGVFWRKMRELSQLLADQGFWQNPDDMFYLNRNEVRDVLWDYSSAWATGGEKAGTDYWPAEIERRRKIVDTLAAQPPIPALNNPPEVITEPFTIMLWGITSESIQRWAQADTAGDDLQGMAGSPGVVEGVARVLRSPDQLGELQKGEVLVTPVTAPSWAPVFGKISAAVTDIGGMMSHAAIVCREYGLPAVTGTGNASSRIKTGMRVRVNGNDGTVTILDE
ncbi:PEP-utilizing enzyme [Pseudoprimorskyibacter insulae]|uniref:Chondramide synthase cmdD n=1 Tax=Pseudoprimorskyibacter insulae TaxID=1695997 RepID=A0A2R8AUE3_9RHOB|nr:PEP-utilizing enzyme [Pseudoprimorskyibacter insulae]SPF79509.1 Chondramide synthase cmdD [Pseudoprimorskyibacter insulae]